MIELLKINAWSQIKACNENFGLGPKVVRGGHFQSSKFGLPGPNLAAKNGPGLEYRIELLQAVWGHSINV